jgi:DNA-binding SARP family transcriptional activator
MLTINTFGGLSLRQGDTSLTGAPTQRRRLALLAMLAVAGETGVTRDKLLAMLWPEGDPEKSRHALNQILSAQRRHFGNAPLFDGKKTVRLNSSLISSDVGSFQEALARGDVAAAVELYAGPFLDGFFVPGSPEFEMWATDQRTRLANLLADSLDAAARHADESGDREAAVRWRRHAVQLDRTDATRAIRLAESLVLAGNRAGALRALGDCQRRIKEELGVPGDPEIGRRMSALMLELGG